MRQSSQLNRSGQQIYYEGPNPASLNTIIGALPANSTRRWRNYLQFIDVTNDCSNLFKLKLTWTKERDDTGQTTPGQPNQKKSASGTIIFEGEAFRLIKAWLLDDVSAPLNTIDVQIEDVGCGTYDNYQIKSTDITWCATSVCQFDVVIKQKDIPLSCIKRTLITNNWQGWFPTDSETPANGKKHPRLAYCNEERPNGKLVAQWYIMITMFSTMSMAILGLALAINPILWLLNQIQNILNSIPGVNVDWNIPDPIESSDIYEGFSSFFVENAGCGRLHPAPLIRDYITNVCDYCGVKVDAETAPIFFAPVITVQTSNPQRGTQGVVTELNPHVNALYAYAPVKRGIRRFKNLGIKALAGFIDLNTTSYWIPENAPLKTLDIFLDELKPLYNMDWEVRSEIINGQAQSKLYIQRKDFFKDAPGEYVFDFTGPDNHKILEGVCLEWTGKKSPALISGLYKTDAVDSCGNEAVSRMGDMMSIGNVDDNPTLEGTLKKEADFGATRFRHDGITGDYIYDALQVVSNGGIVTMLSVGAFMPWILKLWFDTINSVVDTIDGWARYALLLSDETFEKPKVIIWDGNDTDNAKAYRLYGVYTFTPPVNPAYNTTRWDLANPYDTDVIGQKLTVGKQTNGTYTVKRYDGHVMAVTQGALINYPMYFKSGYYNTLWDWFHWIDDPKRNPVLNQNWRVKIALCCEDLKKLKVFGDASKIKLAEKIKLPTGYYQDGKISEITVSYDTNDDLGQYIEIKGDV